MLLARLIDCLVPELQEYPKYWSPTGICGKRDNITDAGCNREWSRLRKQHNEFQSLYRDFMSEFRTRNDLLLDQERNSWTSSYTVVYMLLSETMNLSPWTLRKMYCFHKRIITVINSNSECFVFVGRVNSNQIKRMDGCAEGRTAHQCFVYVVRWSGDEWTLFACRLMGKRQTMRGERFGVRWEVLSGQQQRYAAVKDQESGVCRVIQRWIDTFTVEAWKGGVWDGVVVVD